MPPRKVFQIPALAKLILKRMSLYYERHSIIEDFEETYKEIRKAEGVLRANTWCWKSVIRSVSGYIGLILLWRIIMLKNYLKSALRILKKHKAYSFINIIGLSIGMACFTLLMLYVKYELSFDNFHENSNRIYRTIMDLHTWNSSDLTEWAITSAMLAPTLMEEFPEVEYATRLRNSMGQLRYKEKNFNGTGKYGDENFLNVFSFKLIEGDKKRALVEPFTIVLSEKFAEKFFGNDHPIGKVMTFINKQEYTVTGIIENVPYNSHLQFDYILSFSTLKAMGISHIERWTDINFSTYLLLNSRVSYKEFEKKFELIVEKYHKSDSEATKRSYFLQPLKDIHLKSHYISDKAYNNGDIRHIYLMISIAIGILLIACFNYMNLATACAARRFKEIGIRKTIGAQQSQLIHQFLSESVLLAVLSLTISLSVVCIFLPSFSAIVDANLDFNRLFNWENVFILFGVILSVGLLSGSYPAYFLSSFRLMNILKNTLKSTTSRNPFKLRNIFVVFQFSISIVLILSVIVVQKQLIYIKNNDIGFDRKNIAVVTVPRDNIKEGKYGVIKEELLQNPSIKSVSVSSVTPVAIGNEDYAVIETENAGKSLKIPHSCRAYVDYDYLDLFNIKILQGRNFSPFFMTDKDQGVIVNETFVKVAGLKNPIGKKLIRPDIKNGTIIGVVKDFHFVSFKEKIEPMFFTLATEGGPRISIKISSGNIKQTLNDIETVFLKHSNNFIFNLDFLDKTFNNLYRSEEKLGNILIAFTIITIIIACLGLFGLISFMAERRTKEIGIRKVVGASISNIMTLLVKEFLILVCISIVIALPFAIYVMTKWLEDYVYRINFSAGILLMSVLIALSITLFTVSFQTVKAATANPVDSLRYE